MTIEERNKKLKHLITCMKCEVSGKSCDDNCPTQYEAGNMGEVIENLEAISKILEQQPCDDAVSRQAVHDLIAELLSDYLHDEDREKIEELDVKIEDLEPVTPKKKSEYEHDHDVVKAYNDGQAYILDKIRAEVELLGKDYLGCPQPQVVCDDVIKIIDKYRGDTDGKDSD